MSNYPDNMDWAAFDAANAEPLSVSNSAARNLRIAAALHDLCRHFGFEGAVDAMYGEIDAMVRDDLFGSDDEDDKLACVAEWTLPGDVNAAVTRLQSALAPSQPVNRK